MCCQEGMNTEDVENIPLLDLVEALKKGNRDEDDNGLSAMANLNLEESWCQPQMLKTSNVLASSQCPTPLPCV